MRLASLSLLRTQSDDRLVALARGGNEQAFEAIVERHRRALLRHGRRLLSETSAEDAVQQAFLAAWTALRRGDDVRELSAWLHRILHNVALNLIRGASNEAYAELPDTVASGAAPDEELERRMALRHTLAGVAALPERQREALLRTAVEGRSQAEVARSLGLSHGAVAQLVMRGRRALRAAATALTPPWLFDSLAGAGAGAGTGAATVGRLAAVALVAGSAASGPVLVHDTADRPRRIADVSVVRERPAPVPRAVTPPAGGRLDPRGSGSSGSAGSGHDGSGSGSSGHGGGSGERGGDPGSGGSGSGGGSDARGSGPSTSGGDGSSGGDSGGSGSSGSGSSGSGTQRQRLERQRLQRQRFRQQRFRRAAAAGQAAPGAAAAVRAAAGQAAAEPAASGAVKADRAAADPAAPGSAAPAAADRAAAGRAARADSGTSGSGSGSSDSGGGSGSSGGDDPVEPVADSHSGSGDDSD